MTKLSGLIGFGAGGGGGDSRATSFSDPIELDSVTQLMVLLRTKTFQAQI